MNTPRVQVQNYPLFIFHGKPQVQPPFLVAQHHWIVNPVTVIACALSRKPPLEYPLSQLFGPQTEGGSQQTLCAWGYRATASIAAAIVSQVALLWDMQQSRQIMCNHTRSHEKHGSDLAMLLCECNCLILSENAVSLILLPTSFSRVVPGNWQSATGHVIKK